MSKKCVVRNVLKALWQVLETGKHEVPFLLEYASLQTSVRGGKAKLEYESLFWTEELK